MKALDAAATIRRHLQVGLTVALLFAGGIGALAATTRISGAVIAPGLFVVESHVKKVQHPAGGIVEALLVREGNRVGAGDILIRLDDTQAKASLAIVAARIDELAARQARLEAEREGRAEILFPDALIARRSEAVTVMAGERRLFEIRKTAREGRRAQLRSRIEQLAKERDGIGEQVTAKEREIVLIGRELEAVRALWQQKLAPIDRMTAREREAARLAGERGQLLAASAEVSGRIAETELQILQIDEDLRAEVAKELRDIEAQLKEDRERRVTPEDELRRLVIRAPQNGVVHQLAVHTIGGVIAAGEPLMLIVPTKDALKVEARVAPQDIDQVQPGQQAILRLSAFNQRTTPELIGEVTEISPDTAQDPKSALSFYTVEIAISAAEIARLGSLRIVPGMPVEAFIQTGERTVLSYLLKPLSDQVTRAFRES
jgi:membrane fusion protein, type I secretion system